MWYHLITSSINGAGVMKFLPGIHRLIKAPEEDVQGVDVDIHQLQESSLQTLIVITILSGIFIALFGDIFGLVNWQANILALWMVIPGLFAIANVSSNYSVSTWILFINWTGISVIMVAFFPSQPPLALLTLPILFGGLFLSHYVSLVTWSLLGAAFLIARNESTPEWGFFFAVTGFMVLILWLAMRDTHEMMRWSWQTYRQGRDELLQGREQQGKLNQAVHDLAEANIQMMRLNQLLNAARHQAEEAERVKAEFVANVSHELRTPLNMVLGYCELMMDFPSAYGPKLPARLLADIAAIQRNSQHLTSLISDVLNISQFEAQHMSLRKEWVALLDVMNEAVIAVRPLIESRNLDLKIDLPEDIPLLYFDQTRIRQVLLNLVSNAARITETGGITIRVEHFEELIKVNILDTGPGIAQEDIPKLFQPFRQLDGGLNRKHGGSGLGLNISRNFVELHGGKIGVESQVGVGSNFWFTLPVRTNIGSEQRFERWLNVDYEQRIHPSYANKQRILPRAVVLESSDFLYDQALRTVGDVELERAETPEEALAILNKSPYQVIIVRGETEAQTIQWAAIVSESRFKTPVASCCLPKENTQQELAVERYLVKPVDHRQLFTTIQSLERPVRSILLVDDDIETLQLFARILSTSAEKYRVLQATTGEEALKLLRSRKVDLIILDLHMPGMNGFLFLEEKNRQPLWNNIPVVILSAEDPTGHPVAVPGVFISHHQGLSVAQLFQYALRLGEPKVP
jgi:signal transduction histidine kinase/CheY-like chemotaxis protein